MPDEKPKSPLMPEDVQRRLDQIVRQSRDANDEAQRANTLSRWALVVGPACGAAAAIVVQALAS